MSAKRGRLSSLDTLPDEAEEDIAWAFSALRDRKLTQDEIREQLNLRLQIKGVKEISKSAFNRAAIRTARMAHWLGQTREIAAALADKFGDGGEDEQLTVLVAQTIKTLVFEMLENAGELKATPMTAEMMANMALAIKSSEQAKKTNADLRKLSDDAWRKKATAAIEAAARAQGLSAETVEKIKSQILGIRAEPAS